MNVFRTLVALPGVATDIALSIALRENHAQRMPIQIAESIFDLLHLHSLFWKTVPKLLRLPLGVVGHIVYWSQWSVEACALSPERIPPNLQPLLESVRKKLSYFLDHADELITPVRLVTYVALTILGNRQLGSIGLMGVGLTVMRQRDYLPKKLEIILPHLGRFAALYLAYMRPVPLPMKTFYIARNGYLFVEALLPFLRAERFSPLDFLGRKLPLDLHHPLLKVLLLAEKTFNPSVLVVKRLIKNHLYHAVEKGGDLLPAARFAFQPSGRKTPLIPWMFVDVWLGRAHIREKIKDRHLFVDSSDPANPYLTEKGILLLLEDLGINVPESASTSGC